MAKKETKEKVKDVAAVATKANDGDAIAEDHVATNDDARATHDGSGNASTRNSTSYETVRGWQRRGRVSS